MESTDIANSESVTNKKNKISHEPIDKKRSSNESDEPKPRIVMTFRPEKPGVKSSNMKIVSTEEKHEEVVSRRSTRARGIDVESFDEEAKSNSDINVLKLTPTPSESEEPVSETIPSGPIKRSTRRRSNDNILANAIARKEKSYVSNVSTRPSRRIKPTAKLLANKELRIGLVRHNLASNVADKSEGRVIQTRRSARKAEVTTNNDSLPMVADEEVKDNKASGVGKQTKKKHLGNLGLKEVANDESMDTSNADELSVTQDPGSSVLDESEEVEEVLEEEDEEEIPEDGSDVQSFTQSQYSSEDEYVISQVNKSKRRSPRKNQAYQTEYEETGKSSRRKRRSSEKHEREELSETENEHSEEESDEHEASCRRSLRKRKMICYESDEFESMAHIPGEPASPEQGSEQTCPDDETKVVGTCYCESPSNVYVSATDLEEPVFCRAVETVDGIRVGCSHAARRDQDGGVAAMLRAGPRTPYTVICKLHAKLLYQHMCCPACGMFCTQGTFYQCSEGHLFHLECGLPYGSTKVSSGCPHCGIYSYRWQPVNKETFKVQVDMKCSNKRVFLPEQREQSSQAYLSFTPIKNIFAGQPIIPEDLLPTAPIDLKALCTKLDSDEDEFVTAAAEEQLCEAIVNKLHTDLLIPKIMAVQNITKPLDVASGGSFLHLAARSGNVTAAYLLRCAGAELDLTDGSLHTPLGVAIVASAEKPEKHPETKPMKVEKDDKEDAPEPEAKKPEETEEPIQTDEPMEINETIETKEPIEKNDTIESNETTEASEHMESKEPIEKIKPIETNKPVEINQPIESNKPIETNQPIEIKEPIETKIKEELEEVVIKKEEPVEDIVSKEDLLKVIRYLVAAGADVNFPGPDGMTPLHLAARGGNLSVCGVLVTSHADVSARDAGGWTPLVWAAEHEHADVVRLLIRHGAQVDTVDKEGQSALHWAALSGSADTLAALLDRGPLLDVRNPHGDTPLHIAATQGNYACVSVLLARGARTDIENEEGQLAVEVCTGECQTAISLHMQITLAARDPKRTPSVLLSGDISNGKELYPIPCINDVDDEPVPTDFVYITSHVMPQQIYIDNTIATTQGCDCKNSECTDTCACCILGVKKWYSGGRLLPSFPVHEPPMIFECNQSCSCNPKVCTNSVVSRSVSAGATFVRCAVFRIGGTRGWGLRATSFIPRGSAVMLYCGELLALDMADRRTQDQYMFCLDLKPDLLEQCEDKNQLCVDAAHYGSAARFVNHSCKPNLTPVKVFTSTRDLRLPTIVLFAITDIKAGEELTFDYGDKFWSVKSKFMCCECASPYCRYIAILSDEEHDP